MYSSRIVLVCRRTFANGPAVEIGRAEKISKIGSLEFPSDDFTNVTPKILSHIGRDLHNKPGHPLCLIKKKISKHFYSNYIGRTGTPIFSVHDNISPVVSTKQNFDSLLVPEDHVSRKKSDCYYINRYTLLRGHTTAHQSDLIRSGLDSFLIIGDVYRRDQIDCTHYPVFHQCDGVRLFSNHQLSDLVGDAGADGNSVSIFDKTGFSDSCSKQGCHTDDATQLVLGQLKSTLTSLTKVLFGPECETRWVDAYFPFTHPSFELEIKRVGSGEWIELLGCGVIRQEILKHGGAGDRIGWAFGLGLDRLAMMMYLIPDIRLFWSTDSGFLSQFEGKQPEDNVCYQPISVYPQCTNDISFWLPDDRQFEENDFFELVRDIGGEIVEQIKLKDVWTHPKTGKISRCYSVVYRHHERTLTQAEVNAIHSEIRSSLSTLGASIR